MGFNNTIPNINSRGALQNTFDAIVIGYGMTGGWAAKELCVKELKTLVPERGHNDPWKKSMTVGMPAGTFLSKKSIIAADACA